MKKFLLGLTVAMGLGAFAAPANAITYIAPWTSAPTEAISLNFGDDRVSSASGPGVYVLGATAADGTSSHLWNGATRKFIDTFNFSLPDGIVGFAGVSIGFSAISSMTFDSVTFNGVALTRTDVPVGNGHISSFFSLTPFEVTSGGPQTLIVTGTSGKNASWSGNGTFQTVAIPEPGTWALLILGFGGAGAMIRRRRHSIA